MKELGRLQHRIWIVHGMMASQDQTAKLLQVFHG
uniref:Uncharacterized protein n=1 Tax=Arundo donax TaxID=35708 RepID=A0A0A9G4M2_ARUDO